MITYDEMLETVKTQAGEFKTLHSERISGKTFITTVYLERNELGDVRVNSGGKYIYHGTLSLLKEAVEMFNEEVKRLKAV